MTAQVEGENYAVVLLDTAGHEHLNKLRSLTYADVSNLQ